MGNRKKLKAEQNKIAKKNKSFAILRNCPISPRKMRLVADMVRGKDVSEALDILKYSTKEAALIVDKVILSAVNNWEQKNDSQHDANLFIKEIFVDQGRTMKRIQPRAKGRANRILKRSNHLTVVVDTNNIDIES